VEIKLAQYTKIKHIFNISGKIGGFGGDNPANPENTLYQTRP
jgi:hypothetical protein